MHEIEPFYNWRHIYVSEEDAKSPFYGREYSEFEFSHSFIIIIYTRNGMNLEAALYI